MATGVLVMGRRNTKIAGACALRFVCPASVYCACVGGGRVTSGFGARGRCNVTPRTRGNVGKLKREDLNFGGFGREFKFEF